MTTRKPVIGSYKRPGQTKQDEVPDIKIEDKRPKSADQTPVKIMGEGIQEEIRDNVKSSESLEKKVKSYKEILADNDISESKAHAVVDAMLEKGFYEETLQVTKLATVTFRTRAHSDYIRYLRALELFNPKYVEEQQELQIRYFLAASILGFKGGRFSNPAPGTVSPEEVEEAFKDRLEWLEKQPESVVALLANKLNVFDSDVRLIMSEGVVENF